MAFIRTVETPAGAGLLPVSCLQKQKNRGIVCNPVARGLAPTKGGGNYISYEY